MILWLGCRQLSSADLLDLDEECLGDGARRDTLADLKMQLLP
jgi:hypothetical protein